MNWRARAKYLLLTHMPFARGRFSYFGILTYFPLGSHIFARACTEDVYERSTVDFLLGACTPASVYFDVGANIGLTSIPLVALRPSVMVVSIEASDETSAYLARTHQRAARQNWRIINCAVGAENSMVEFWSAGAPQGAFDGLRDTGRGGSKQKSVIQQRTLDDIWTELGTPEVSVIKLDIEGGESAALRGATACLETCRPTLLLEWHGPNLSAYGIAPAYLLELSTSLGYRIHAFPSLVQITSHQLLLAAMSQTDMFILLPDE